MSIKLQENSHPLFKKVKPLTKSTNLREERQHNETSHIVLGKTNYFINSDLGKSYNSSMWHKENKLFVSLENTALFNYSSELLYTKNYVYSTKKC